MAPTSPNSSSPRAMKYTASSAAPPPSTTSASSTYTRTTTPRIPCSPSTTATSPTAPASAMFSPSANRPKSTTSRAGPTIRVSFDMPVYTVQTDALGTIMLLEAVRDLRKIHRLPRQTLPGLLLPKMFPHGQGRRNPPERNHPFHPAPLTPAARSTPTGKGRQLPQVLQHVRRQRHPL